MNRYIGNQINYIFKDINSLMQLLYQCSNQGTRNIVLKRIEKQMDKLSYYIRAIDDQILLNSLIAAEKHTNEGD